MAVFNSSDVTAAATGTSTQWNNLRGDMEKQIEVKANENITAGELVNFIDDTGLEVELTFSGAVLDAANYSGIAQDTIASGSTGTINLPGGIDNNQTGMTPGAVQYIDDDGTLTETNKYNGVAGIALSATEVLISKNLYT